MWNFTVLGLKLVFLNNSIYCYIKWPRERPKARISNFFINVIPFIFLLAWKKKKMDKAVVHNTSESKERLGKLLLPFPCKDEEYTKNTCRKMQWVRGRDGERAESRNSPAARDQFLMQVVSLMADNTGLLLILLCKRTTSDWKKTQMEHCSFFLNIKHFHSS